MKNYRKIPNIFEVAKLYDKKAILLNVNVNGER